MPLCTPIPVCLPMADGPALVLIGAPGAGKTKIGKRVAATLSLPFIDTDRRVVEKHGPISAIFSSHGEAQFRRFERAEVSSALGSRGIVALGGGAVLDTDTQSELESRRVALITVTPGAVAARIASGADKRPLLVGGLPAWIALVEARMPIYESLADRRFDTSNRPIDRVAHEVAEWLLREGV